jgi:hypothetical protein
MPKVDGGGIFPQAGLPFAALMIEQAPRKAELQGLHHHRRRAALRLADQQMKVLGHDHVSENHNAVALPHLFQHGEQQIASPRTNPGQAAGDSNCR